MDVWHTTKVLYYKYSISIHVALPLATYSQLGTLAIVFLVTDFLRYRFVIIVSGIAFVVTNTLMIWGQGLASLFVIFHTKHYTVIEYHFKLTFDT